MAMNFAGASQRVRGLLAPKKPEALAKSALTEDTLRDNIVRDAGAHSERFNAATDKRPVVEWERTHEDGSTTREEYEWETFPEAVRDFARAAFGWDEPQVRPRDEVRPSHRFNREVMQAAINSEGMRELRPYSRNNEQEALYGAIVGADELRGMAGSVLADHVARSEQMSEQEHAQQSAEDMLEQLRQRAKQEVQDQGAVQDDTRREVKRALKRIEQAQGKLEQLMHEEGASSMVVDAIAAGERMTQTAAEAAEAFGQLPGIGGGEAHNLSLDQQIELAEKWAANPNLKAIARMLGRMLRSMVFKREARTKNVSIEPVGVTTGNDLARLLPHELARAYSSNTLIKTSFVKDFAERSLLQYDMEGKAPAGKGPIITVHDGSGSMGGEKFVWATSLCLSVLTIAQRERRQFAGAEFGSAGQIKSWIFPANQAPDPNDVLDYATHFFAGGTSTLTGMQEALRIMREHPEFKTADVLLIGDGIDYFREADKKVRDELRALGCRIHGISILQKNNTYMQQMCESVVDVADLAGANDATDHVAENIT